MGAVAGHVGDCHPDRSRECAQALADDCGASEASGDEAVGGASDPQCVEEIGIRNLCARLCRLAGAEGGPKHEEEYKWVLLQVLGLLVGVLPKPSDTQIPMASCIVVVAPDEELHEVHFKGNASNCSSLAGLLLGMAVDDTNFEQGLEKLLKKQAFSNGANGDSSVSVLTVDFCSGIVGTSLVVDHMEPVDIAGRLSRGVLFTRSSHGLVRIFPAADVQRGQVWQLKLRGLSEDEPITQIREIMNSRNLASHREIQPAPPPRTRPSSPRTRLPTPMGEYRHILQDEEATAMSSATLVAALSSSAGGAVSSSATAAMSSSSSKKFHSIDCVYEDAKTGGKVYVGGHVAAKNLNLLRKYKITKIVNCQDTTSENFFETGNEFGYFRFPVTSWSSAPRVETNAGVLQFFAPLFRFVDQALARGDNVLIHCLAGAYRSGTAAAAVLMHRTTQSSTEALKELQRRRPVVNTILDLGELLVRLDCALERTVVL